MGRAEDIYKQVCKGGEESINKFILDSQSEELFLDFKRSANDGDGRKLHDDDRKNLSKAISGFGNSEGGVLIWGIDCRNIIEMGDVAMAKFPIKNPKRFLSWIEGAISGCTVPAHPKVLNHAIENSQGFGFVVTYISKSYFAPHQCLKPYPQYYIRAGSDFVPTPHSVLAGLFGRHPQPFVFHEWSLGPTKKFPIGESGPGFQLSLGVKLASWGPGIAKNLYLNVIYFPPRGGSVSSIYLNDPDNWTGIREGNVAGYFIANESLRLAPHAFVEPIFINIQFTPPFESDPYLKIIFGCEGSPTRKIENRVELDKFQATYQFLSDMEGPLTMGDEKLIQRDFLGLEPLGPDINIEEYGLDE
ncbi:MAG: helix-turn-helix domain-containing protein [Nitrospirales bacterium]